MEPDQLFSLLAGFTTHLQSATAEDKAALSEIQEALASTLINRSGGSFNFQNYVFQNSDLFSVQKLKPAALDQIKSVIEKASLKGADELKQIVVVRDSPVRTTQLGNTISKTVAGARIDKTIGPIKQIDGRDIFIDFINIRKLIALYVQGQNNPAVLFNASFNVRRITPIGGAQPELTKTYNVIPDSVWINARLLSTTAPDNLYCGLRVKGGKITLDALPVYANNKLTVSSTTTVSVSLDLEQKTDFETDAASPYGADARNALLNLPKLFAFSFKGAAKTIQQVGDSNWQVYGQLYNLKYQNEQNVVYNPLISRVAIPVKCDQAVFTIQNSVSPFLVFDGNAPVKSTWWTIPVAQIDITKPLEADGNGGFVFECGEGISTHWGLAPEKTALKTPFFIGEPGRIGLTDFKSNGSGISQKLDTWKDAQNPFGTSIDINYRKDATYIFNTVAKGDELLMTVADAVMNVDRPVKVNGEAVAVRSKNSVIILAVNKVRNAIAFIDDNILWDNKLPAQKIPVVKPFALALHNALFTVTPANGAILFGNCDKDFTRIDEGNLYLSFGLYSYLPTLPDPYAANLGVLKQQFLSDNPNNPNGKSSRVFMWLVSRTRWEKNQEADDTVDVSFHFAPLAAALDIVKESKTPTAQFQAAQSQPVFTQIFGTLGAATPTNIQGGNVAGTDVASVNVSSKRGTTGLQLEDFTLLDVSSNANQMGIAYTGINTLNRRLFTRFDIKIDDQNNSAQAFPIQVSGLDVVTPGYNARAFTVPQIAWEPVLNFTKPGKNPVPVNPEWPNPSNDPPLGFNYYPNDGLATRIGNFSPKPVALAPIPMVDYLEKVYKDKTDGKTYAIFNLPFGMWALTILDNKSGQKTIPDIGHVTPSFSKKINGGIQLELTAGTTFSTNDEDNLFQGYTAQLINVQDMFGNTGNWSTLGSSVEKIFNGEFSSDAPPANDKSRPGVPLKRIGISGYGASIFSDWHNRDAAFAETSQAMFNVATGRTSHEVIQVKSVIYPWGIFVVRTVTLFRLNNGFVGRVDSGWKAETDGKFYFNVKNKDNPYEVHPGIINGLYNIKNIRETEVTFGDTTIRKPGDLVFNERLNKEEVFPTPDNNVPSVVALLRGLTFDCDIDIEGVIEGANAENRVPSKGITGYVQLAPRGTPIDVNVFKNLLISQQNSIGGPVNCSIQVAGTNQVMKLSRVDVNNSVDKNGKPIFVAAARGSVVLPKDGSWSMVTHTRSDGMVSPLPQNISVPLIREGITNKGLIKDADRKNLSRIAHPTEIVRNAVADTVNFGFLQNLNSQKVLFLTPSFKNGINSLLSKTPPLLADAYRLMNTNSVFPNIGDAESNFGTAIQLLNGKAENTVLKAFAEVKDGVNQVMDGGKQVLEILSIDTAKDAAGKVVDQGFKLLKQKGNDLLNDAFRFDLPGGDYSLVGDETSPFRIYIQYKATSNPKKAPKDYIGNMDFDVDSFAGDMSKQWKGRMNNLAMIVDLGPLKKLMKIKGNFNASKGAETDFGSKSADNTSSFPTPEIEFSKELEPVINILEILSELSQGNYADALKKGLKVAMSNNANIWEYKFEATKDIPLVRFPPGTLYESPQTPLKLEASMRLGVYFNAALKVTTDPKQLLPTAGAFFQFHGGLQVMCVSVGAGTIYAVGNVDLKLAADTSPLVALTMKFGFGAQVGVGLPVIGSVSILFMAGVEIYVDTTKKVAVTAFLLFRGHAEILGGLVGVTITIEAKGTVEKAGDDEPCNCRASVTFALDISIFLIIDISFSESWEETRQIA